MFICPLARTFVFREQLIYKLRKLDYNVVLLSENGMEVQRFTSVDCRFEEIHMDRRGKSVFNDEKLLLDYYRIIKKIHPDLVLLYTTKCSVYGGMVCRVLRIPYIVNNAGLIDSNGLFSKFLNLLYKLGFGDASCMMYQNSEEQRIVQSLLKNKTHFRRIPGSGVDLNEYKYVEYPNNDFVTFNYVARIMKSKGIEEYLECAKQVHKSYPKTRFRIYGTFDDERYEKIIKEYERRGIVEFCGQKKDMRPEIENASAVIHPSYYEGMTNVVLEHSAMGRPCIGTDVAGVADGILNGRTGYVFKKGDVNALIKSVERFIGLSWGEKREMGKNARCLMEQRFDRKIVTKIYLEEIKLILGEEEQ